METWLNFQSIVDNRSWKWVRRPPDFFSSWDACCCWQPLSTMPTPMPSRLNPVQIYWPRSIQLTRPSAAISGSSSNRPRTRRERRQGGSAESLATSARKSKTSSTGFATRFAARLNPEQQRWTLSQRQLMTRLFCTFFCIAIRIRQAKWRLESIFSSQESLFRPWSFANEALSASISNALFLSLFCKLLQINMGSWQAIPLLTPVQMTWSALWRWSTQFISLTEQMEYGVKFIQNHKAYSTYREFETFLRTYEDIKTKIDPSFVLMIPWMSSFSSRVLMSPERVSKSQEVYILQKWTWKTCCQLETASKNSMIKCSDQSVCVPSYNEETNVNLNSCKFNENYAGIMCQTSLKSFSYIVCFHQRNCINILRTPAWRPDWEHIGDRKHYFICECDTTNFYGDYNQFKCANVPCSGNGSCQMNQSFYQWQF